MGTPQTEGDGGRFGAFELALQLVVGCGLGGGPDRPFGDVAFFGVPADHILFTGDVEVEHGFAGHLREALPFVQRFDRLNDLRVVGGYGFGFGVV